MCTDGGAILNFSRWVRDPGSYQPEPGHKKTDESKDNRRPCWELVIKESMTHRAGDLVLWVPDPDLIATIRLVPRRGLEPPRLSALVPETSASTNSATWAFQENKDFISKKQFQPAGCWKKSRARFKGTETAMVF